MLQQKYSRRRPGTVVHAENPRRLEDFKLRPMPDPVSKKKKKITPGCNPSYLGDRDWEDCGLRPAQAKS
jgi:hypothetical protein